jgi:hypothetical protein
MYADRPGGSQSIPSVDTKPTAADKQPFIAQLENQRLPVIRPFTQKFGHPHYSKLTATMAAEQLA